MTDDERLTVCQKEIMRLRRVVKELEDENEKYKKCIQKCKTSLREMENIIKENEDE